MSEIIACPSCDRRLRVRPELQGHAVKCPSCQTTFTPAEPAPPPVPPRRRERDEEEDYDDRPRRTSRDDPDDNYDDRPRRRRRREDYDPHRGTLVLVLGIAGLLCMFWPITSVIAWVLGASDLREIRAGRMDPEGESSTHVGWILGIIGTVLFALVFVGFCLIFSLAIVFGH